MSDSNTLLVVALLNKLGGSVEVTQKELLDASGYVVVESSGTNHNKFLAVQQKP